MKHFYLIFLAIVVLFTPAFSQRTMIIDLHKLVKENGIEVVNRELTLVNEPDHSGIRLSKAYGEGIAWVKGIDFSNGILEFDVRGENVKQHSFVGIAFHGRNDSTYDAVYLRPFQFKEHDAVLKNRMIQYIALPQFTWRKLREQFPTKYEHSIEPAPDPDSWVRIRMVIKGSTVSTYINDSREPSLVIEKVSDSANGMIGFYVADTSGGDFANLTITKTN
jgi:hypothetical protein